MRKKPLKTIYRTALLTKNDNLVELITHSKKWNKTAILTVTKNAGFTHYTHQFITRGIKSECQHISRQRIFEYISDMNRYFADHKDTHNKIYEFSKYC